MNQSWSRNVLFIALLFSFRMLGLFMLIPVFTLYAPELEHATPQLIGIALGAYGLSQGLLQIPFGMLSDRWGRVPLIVLGLLLFAGGSLIGAYSHSIYSMILARAMQGSGAIGSVLMALLADLTPDTQRTKAMAAIGGTIGLSFSLAVVISPSFCHQFGLSGIFYLTFGLAILGLLLTQFLHKPTPNAKLTITSQTFKLAITDKTLQRLNLGIFFQHLILTATFFAIPPIIHHHAELGHFSTTWHFYLPLMTVGFLLMIPCIVIAEKKQKIKPLFLAAIAITGACQLCLSISIQYWYGFISLMLGYFVAFNILEANLPSLISKQAHSSNRGTAMGIYSSSQFLGIFTGGSLAGLVYSLGGEHRIFLLNSVICVLWFLISYRMNINTSKSSSKLQKNTDSMAC